MILLTFPCRHRSDSGSISHTRSARSSWQSDPSPMRSRKDLRWCSIGSCSAIAVSPFWRCGPRPCCVSGGSAAKKDTGGSTKESSAGSPSAPPNSNAPRRNWMRCARTRCGSWPDKTGQSMGSGDVHRGSFAHPFQRGLVPGLAAAMVPGRRVITGAFRRLTTTAGKRQHIDRVRPGRPEMGPG